MEQHACEVPIVPPFARAPSELLQPLRLCRVGSVSLDTLHL